MHISLLFIQSLSERVDWLNRWATTQLACSSAKLSRCLIYICSWIRTTCTAVARSSPRSQALHQVRWNGTAAAVQPTELVLDMTLRSRTTLPQLLIAQALGMKSLLCWKVCGLSCTPTQLLPIPQISGLIQSGLLAELGIDVGAIVNRTKYVLTHRFSKMDLHQLDLAGPLLFVAAMGATHLLVCCFTWVYPPGLHLTC